MAKSKHDMAKSKVEKIKAFQNTVLSFYKENGRCALPWRKTKNPYRILVSEVMLQQTQVDRVIPYYKTFLRTFPTVKELSKASLGDVLKVWQGLGYNRRAKMLHNAALAIATNHKGAMPKTYEELVTLSGVGDYTAKAVRVFAYNEKEFLIETNIRSVYIHHFFKKNNVSDKEILSLLEKTHPKNVEPRDWYAALMDYGSYIKRTTPNPSRKSKHHTKQKAFKGSNREVRGALIRALNEKPYTFRQLERNLPFDSGKIKEQLRVLEGEQMLVRKRGMYQLP